MFRYDDKSSCHWFTNMAVDNLAEFNLVGVVSFFYCTQGKQIYIFKMSEAAFLNFTNFNSLDVGGILVILY